jgi:hypothetical protein
MNENLKRLSRKMKAIERPIVKVVEPEIRSVAKYALLGTPAKKGADEGSARK